MSVMDACGDFDTWDGIVRLEVGEGGTVDGTGFSRRIRLRIAATSCLDMLVIAIGADFALGVPCLDVGNAAPCGDAFPKFGMPSSHEHGVESSARTSCAESICGICIPVGDGIFHGIYDILHGGVMAA